MRNTFLRPAIFGMVIGMMSTGCGSTGVGRSGAAPDPTILRIGVTPNSPPVVYVSGRQPIGLEVDFGRQLASDLGRSPQIISLDWDDLIPAIEENRIDIIMSGMSITSMRQARVAFIDPYSKVGQMALVRRVDYARYANPFILVNTKDRVGTEKGTTGDLFVQTRMRNAERLYYRSPEDGAKALLSKKVDVLIADAPTIWWLAANYEAEGLRGVFEPLTEEHLAWAVSRANPTLHEEVSNVIARWREDGTLDMILRRWIP